MTKTTYINEMPYTYHPDKAGAKYCIGEGKYCNCGEFLESVAKHHRGLDYIINPTTKWNEGSDIESEHASVKSGKASLACLYGTDLLAILNEYFANVASTKWIYMVMVNDQITEYHMNAREFREFCIQFGRVIAESGSHKTKVRLLGTSTKTIKWLEDRVVA